MKKRKFTRRFISNNIIFLSIIFSMSIIGVGYASWNDDTKINLSLKTGFIKPIFYLDDEIPSFSDGDLILSLSDDGNTLLLTGEVYPTFNKNITIKIIDEGTIPSVYKDLKQSDENISELDVNSKGKQMKNMSINKDYIESFELNISPNKNENEKELNNNINVYSNEVPSLEQQIQILEEQINEYEKEKNYEFKYVINFEQSL